LINPKTFDSDMALKLENISVYWEQLNKEKIKCYVPKNKRLLIRSKNIVGL